MNTNRLERAALAAVLAFSMAAANGQEPARVRQAERRGRRPDEEQVREDAVVQTAGEPPASELDALRCPPGDRNDWEFKPERLRASSVQWIELSDAAFNAQCETWRSPGVNIAACAYVFPEPDHPWNYGIIYTRVPRWQMSESLQEHEMCHLKGWVHGKHYAPWQPAFRYVR